MARGRDQEPGCTPPKLRPLDSSNDAPNLRLQGLLAQVIYLEAQANLADSKSHLNSNASMFCISFLQLFTSED